MQAKTLVFYGNASATIGSGHVMRLMALADAFQTAGSGKVNLTILFCAKSCPESLKFKLAERGFKWQQAPEQLTAEHLNQFNADVLVIDDYFLTQQEWQAIAQSHALTLALDDAIANHPLPVDAVLNPAPDQQETVYRRRITEPSERASVSNDSHQILSASGVHTTGAALLFLGPRYTLLRREFRETPIPEFAQRQRILITLGGSDVKGLSLPLLAAVTQSLPKVPITLIVGGLTTLDENDIQRANVGGAPLKILRNAENMAEVMAECGLAISAGGGTLGELAAMGVPTLALVCVDNQLPALNSSLEGSWYLARDMRNWQVTEHFDVNAKIDNSLAEITQLLNQLWHNPCKRNNMSQKARQIVDSCGLIELAGKLLNHKKAR
ncbi:hypothetical protein KJI95_10465 [Shewanella sp. JM162201]|uniref:UDP-2,4-diacetamido-2,4,6-trideoxy-beta-L-altropyranose hydrolase n=1 Tax=Shewanella jiangmenensis TaxID=2837387 RepID=A0ABS5V5Q4_9GAMM|nr:hypothetical protein [Shewanella jiangmenensis]MBT1444946.1 hypothetical protein [Shewanella jiangmenensis]